MKTQYLSAAHVNAIVRIAMQFSDSDQVSSASENNWETPAVLVQHLNKLLPKKAIKQFVDEVTDYTLEWKLFGQADKWMPSRDPSIGVQRGVEGGNNTKPVADKPAQAVAEDIQPCSQAVDTKLIKAMGDGWKAWFQLTVEEKVLAEDKLHKLKVAKALTGHEPMDFMLFQSDNYGGVTVLNVGRSILLQAQAAPVPPAHKDLSQGTNKPQPAAPAKAAPAVDNPHWLRWHQLESDKRRQMAYDRLVKYCQSIHAKNIPATGWSSLPIARFGFHFPSSGQVVNYPSPLVKDFGVKHDIPLKLRHGARPTGNALTIFEVKPKKQDKATTTVPTADVNKPIHNSREVSMAIKQTPAAPVKAAAKTAAAAATQAIQGKLPAKPAKPVAPAKPAGKPAGKPAAPVKPAAGKKAAAPAKEKKQTATGLIVDMLLAHKSTDEEIVTTVQKQFGAEGYTTRPAYVSLVRSDINHSLMAVKKVEGMGITLPLCRMLRNEKGKLVEIPAVRE